MLLRRNGQLFFWGIVTAMLVGCSSSPEGGPGDSGDSGGLDTAIDVALDTSADTAGDTSSDRSADAPPNPVGEGYAVGQISMNWTLNDKNGKPVSLYDYRGKVIYFESGSEW